MQTLTLAIAVSVLGSGVAVASTGDEATGVDAPCWKSGTTMDIANGFAKSGKQADTDLNRTYAQILSVLDTADRQRLQKAEKAWVAYRDAACEAEYALWGGGTGGPPAQLACVDAETRHHLSYLQVSYRLRLQRLGP